MSKKVPNLHCIICDSETSSLLKNGSKWAEYINKIVSNGDFVVICTHLSLIQKVHSTLAVDIPKNTQEKMSIIFELLQKTIDRNGQISKAMHNFEILSLNDVTFYDDSSEHVEEAKKMGVAEAIIMPEMNFDSSYVESDMEELIGKASMLPETVVASPSTENLTASTSSVETNIKLTQPDYNLSVMEVSGQNSSYG